MELSNDELQPIIDRIIDLYVIQTKRYLMQFENGEYKKNNPEKPLRKFYLQEFLRGRRTIGVFSGEHIKHAGDHTKFLCFDVDYSDLEIAKWRTYQIGYALDQLGLSDYYISFSGKKGYHIELFFDRPITVKLARQLHKLVIRKAEIPSETTGKVEYRPSDTQGVKLPIGIHKKTGKFCGFCCISTGLEVMNWQQSISYMMKIQKTKVDIIQNIIDEDIEMEDADMYTAIKDYQPLVTYEQNEENSLSYVIKLYNNGMSGPNQRHNSFFKLARLMNYWKYSEKEAVKKIMEWLDHQDRRLYETKREDCRKDAIAIVKYIYKHNITLAVQKRDLTVNQNEIDAIIRSCRSKNQKLLMYAILIHSKRWANNAGIFYISYAQMEQITGITERTAINLVKKMKESGILEIIAANQKQKGTFKKKPNEYRITMDVQQQQKQNNQVLEWDFEKEKKEFKECLQFFYSDKEIRRSLSRREYTALINPTA